MKTANTLTALIVIAIASNAWGQGDLAPPGAPSPTMKTLEQIEPRVPISSLPSSIRDPGSYYVTEDLTGLAARDGITIDADDVTLDLNGFTLRGVTGSRTGVLVLGAQRNLTIKNGVVRDWGIHGIDGRSTSHARFANLQFLDNVNHGLFVGANCLVENCQASLNGDHGILIGDEGQVRNCLADGNSGNGIVMGGRCQVLDSVCSGNDYGLETGAGATVVRCTATMNLVHGVISGAGSLVRDCSAVRNGQIGIVASDGGTIMACNVVSNSTDGILVSQGCTVRENMCMANGAGNFGAGVHVTGNDNRIEDNHLLHADRGFWVVGTDNYVAGNTVRENGQNYYFSSGNQLNLLLCELPESIDWPAVVTLAGTLTGEAGEHGITIDSSEVTIDLAGHSLVGVAGSDDGIYVVNTTPDHKNVTIQNGTVRNWDGHGLDASYCSNGVVRAVKATQNGLNGIEVADDWVIEHCQALNNGAVGILVSDNSIISECVATFNASNGVRAASVCIVRNCVTQRNGAAGIRVNNDNYVVGNTSDDNDRDGIRLSNGDNRVIDNHVTDNDWRGLAATSSGNLVIRNTAAANDTNFFFAINNRHGPVVNVMGVNGDISGTANSDHPWANFEF